MNALEHRKRNRRLGFTLCLLFVGLFIVTTSAIITGSKAPPGVEEAIESIRTPVLGLIGLLLIIVAAIEIVHRIVKSRDAAEIRVGLILCLLFVGLFIVATSAIITGSKAPPGVEEAIESVRTPVLGLIGLLLIIVAAIEIVHRIVKSRVRKDGAE